MADFPAAITVLKDDYEGRNLALGKLGEPLLAADVNKHADEIMAIEGTLGTYPQGGEVTVAVRLDNLDADKHTPSEMPLDEQNKVELSEKQFIIKLGDKYFKFRYDSVTNTLLFQDVNMTPVDNMEFGAVPLFTLNATEIKLNSTKLGFFGNTPESKIEVSAIADLVTTEDAGDNYTATEKAMLNHMKTDIAVIHQKVKDLLDALWNVHLV